MGYTTVLYAQDSSIGRVGEVLEGIRFAAASIHPYAALDVAVAYASRRGVDLLVRQLSLNECWPVSTKRFLISMDFGISEPSAFVRLASLSNTEVRVPNGNAVVRSRALRPPAVFHTKAFMFRTAGDNAPTSVAVGSANLTFSALTTGSEVISVQAWSGRLSARDRESLAECRRLNMWFDDAWDRADPLTAVLASYREKYTRDALRRAMLGDNTKAVEAFLGDSHRVETAGPLAVQLASAQALWIRTHTLYHNLTTRAVGNQLDTPRGTRIFFGFSADKVPRNTIFGHIELQVPGFPRVRRSVRFGNNEMDKVNLPIPGEDGPASYDESVLIFERNGVASSGLSLFTLTVTDSIGLNRRKASAANVIDLEMSGGRPYGLLF